MADGLSHSSIQSIGQDKYGFIWVGTQNGLNIYDGIRFKHFFSDAKDETSLSGSNITNLLFDKDSVWIATRTGLCIMDVKTKFCRRIDLGENIEVRTLFLEKNKNILWVGAVSGLIKLNIESNQFQEYNTTNSNISHNTVRTIFKDSENNLWVGTFDKLNLLKPQSEVFKSINLKTRQNTNIKYNLVLSICPYSDDNDSLLYVGTETGLVLYNRNSDEMEFFHEENSNLSNSVIKAILKSKSGTVWLGTDFGLGEMNDDFEITSYFHDLNKNNSLVNSIVWDIFEDSSGTIWFGTNNGLSILSNTRVRFEFCPITYQYENNLLGYEIRDIIETSEGNYWIASQNGAIKYGLNKQLIEVLNSSQEGKRKLTDDNITRLFEDPKGNIWIATNGGLAIWNIKEEKLTRYSADNTSGKGLRSNFIESFHQLEDGTLLVNTQKGLHKAIENESGFEFEFLRTTHLFIELSGNYLWSYIGANLFKTNVVSFERNLEITFEVPEKNIEILSILFTDENNIWLGERNGLIHYNLNTGQYNYYKIKSNRNYPLISLLADNNGNIWASSYSAILKFSIDTKNFDIYPSGDEIPINHFERKCAFKSSNGDLIFGGQDGFIRFSPENITKSDFVSPVFFTNLVVSNQEVIPNKPIEGNLVLRNDIAFTSDLVLNHNNKSFSVEFSSLHYGSREGIRYAHKLENIDTEWNYTNGHIGTASYSNLKPGNYTLKVKGTNKDGDWNEKETSLHIKIKPPFWASPIIVVLYVIALILVIGSMIVYYRNRVKMKSQLKIARLEKEHANSLSKTRQQFFVNIAHEFRTPLSLIIGPTEKLEKQKDLSITSKDYVRIIENNARRLLWLNNQLLDFRKLETKTMALTVSEFNIIEFAKNIYELFVDKAERKNIEYQFQSDFEQLNVFMDIRKIETILFNLLSNAFKFTSENGKIIVRIKSDDLTRNNKSNAGILISVCDSGIGITEAEQTKIFERFYQADEAIKMERGSGIGLTLVKEYVNMHQGEIKLKSEVGKGSEFKIVLPLLSEPESKQFLVSKEQQIQPLLRSETKVDSKIILQKFGAPNILLVEDDNEIAEFISMGFKDKFNVKTARNGKEALNFISQKVPDLVISDINMPEMDGIEFTKRFKSNPKTAHIPLILLTGQSQSEIQLEGLKSGADAYMIKPFEIELLEVRIDNFLKRQEQLSQFIKIKDISKPKDFQITTQDEKMLEKVVASIEKFISDPDLNIEKVCADTGFSHSMLYRKIKNLTGQTLNEFIRTVRVQRAEQLLRTKKFNVAEVMHETGFTNHSYFSKSFRKLYKVSPKEYVNKL